MGAARQQRKHEAKLAEYQYSKDVEMWNRENEYNTPEAQMQRLEKAGLNKNLVYGQSTVAGNSTGTTPKYQAPRAEYKSPDLNPLINSLGEYQDTKMKQAQTDNLKAQTEVAQQKAQNDFITNSILKTKASQSNIDLTKAEATLPYQLNMAQEKSRQETIKTDKLLASKEMDKMNLSIKQQQKIGAKLDNFFKSKRNELAKMGVYQGDSQVIRFLIQAFMGGNSFDQIINSMSKNRYKSEGKRIRANMN